MAAIRIVVIGANDANVEEIKSVVVASIGGIATVMTATVDSYRKISGADLYVCLINREQEVSQIVGAEKVFALTLVPPTEYFLAISKIPANSPVIVFNNSTAGVRVLMSCLSRYGLTHLCYDIVAYDECDHRQVAAKIASASYIIGGIAYVGPGKTLYSQFGQYLAPDAAVLVSPPRIATADSVSRLCHQVSSLYHKTIMAKLERLAAIDFLTGIANRRSFVHRFNQEWRRAKREKAPLALAMIDVDFFKRYNDHYGHVAGDRCLKAIARTLKKALRRPADFCARYGGEEFAIILPSTDAKGAGGLLENIRASIKALAIAHAYSPIATVVTVSIGFAAVHPPAAGLTAEALLRRADQALYEAKQSGRDRTVPAAPSSLSPAD
ncbi:MAG: diguanylate cyclase [Sporomusaceae bacterium]|nr:diguanylate cyclase [Sporomusaceae bacterium]